MKTLDEKLLKDTHCSYCGVKFAEQKTYPRKCFHCGNDTFLNPTPVVVMVIPIIGHGYLIQQRGEAPGQGEWALPGGFVEANETWQHAAARELKEEMNLDTDEKHYMLTEIKSDEYNHMLIFCMHNAIHKSDLKNFVPNKEVLDYKFINRVEDVKLCFPTHNEILKSLIQDDCDSEFQEAFDKEDIDTL